MNKRKPVVMDLHIHLEHGQIVYFEDEAQAQRQLTVGPAPDSTLTAFFRLCKENTVGHGRVSARELLYVDVSKHFTWDKTKKRFKPRGRDIQTVGRVHYVKIADGEKYFLRLLLFNVRGPTSFTDLRTVDGVVCNSFRDAAEKLGLLESDKHHEAALQEASLWASAHQMRELFALILTYGPVSAPDRLWEQFARFFTEDVERALASLEYKGEVTEDLREAYGFFKLNSSLQNMGKGIKDVGFTSSLTERMLNVAELGSIPVGRDEILIERSKALFHAMQQTLNEDQRSFVDHVLTTYRQKGQTLSFLDGPGGTGKTYALNTVLHFFEGQGLKPISVSSSGVSALLLSGDTTAHSAFNIPLTIDETSTCDLNGRDKRSRRIISAPLIIWDEVSMQHKHCIEAVDRSLQHICKDQRPFGGISIVFSGDFRQTLPIIPHGTLFDQKNACLKASFLWQKIKSFRLRVNVRLKRGTEEGSAEVYEYAKWLVDLGDGNLQTQDRSLISLQHVNIQVVAPFMDFPAALVSWLYNDLAEIVSAPESNRTATYFSERGLISPFNETVSNLNELILGLIPGELVCSVSIDEPDSNFVDPVTPEVLNNIDFPGFPQHRLFMKIGQPVMILRNLSIGSGLCNGTRLVILSVSSYILRFIVITGPKR